MKASLSNGYSKRAELFTAIFNSNCADTYKLCTTAVIVICNNFVNMLNGGNGARKSYNCQNTLKFVNEKIDIHIMKILKY